MQIQPWSSSLSFIIFANSLWLLNIEDNSPSLEMDPIPQICCKKTPTDLRGLHSYNQSQYITSGVLTFYYPVRKSDVKTTVLSIAQNWLSAENCVRIPRSLPSCPKCDNAVHFQHSKWTCSPFSFKKYFFKLAIYFSCLKPNKNTAQVIYYLSLPCK